MFVEVAQEGAQLLELLGAEFPPPVALDRPHGVEHRLQGGVARSVSAIRLERVSSGSANRRAIARHGHRRDFDMTAPRSLRELFDQIGLQEVPSTDGTVIMEMPVDERVMNTAGGLQGGLIATMADVTAGQLAARSTPFGHGIATTDLFIRYLRPIKVGPARAVARILRTGKRSVVVQVDIYRGDDGELGSTATVNFAAVG